MKYKSVFLLIVKMAEQTWVAIPFYKVINEKTNSTTIQMGKVLVWYYAEVLGLFRDSSMLHTQYVVQISKNPLKNRRRFEVIEYHLLIDILSSRTVD